MITKPKPTAKIIAYTFIAWAIVLGILSFSISLPILFFSILQYILVVVVFGVVFWFFYQKELYADFFHTTAVCFLSFSGFEFLFWNFMYEGEIWITNYTNWIFPVFLMVGTVYGVGKYLR